MTQESRLVIVIDSKNAERNVKALAEELSKITDRGDSAATASKEYGKQVSVTNNIVQNFNTTVNNSNSVVNKTTEATKQAAQQTEKFGQELKSTKQELDKQKGSLSSYGTSIKALVGYMAGLVTINEAISRADGYTQMAARIRNATDSAAEYDLVQKRLFESTKSTFRALNEAQEVYLGLAGGMKALGYQTKDTLDVSDSLSFSFVANAARADQAQSAIDAFSKSMAKGKIDADAWISIVSAADNVIADMAKTTGKSEVEIRQLGATGKISLEDLIKTLKATKDSNKELADAMENSLADGLTTLSNAVTKYIGEMNMAMGITNNASGVLGVLADNIDIVMNAAMAGGLAYLTKTIIAKTVATDKGILSSIASRRASMAQAQAEVAEATAAVNAAKAHLANVQATNAEAQAKYGATAAATRYAQAQAAVTAATNAQTAAQKKLSLATMSFGRLASGAFALVGGPIGAITLGVAGLTAAYSYFNNKTEEVNQKLEEQAEAVKLTKEEIKALTDEQRKDKLGDLAATLKDQNKTLKQQELAVGSALIAIQNYAVGNVKVADISNKARLGTISYTEAIEQLKDQKIPSDLSDALLKQVNAYDDAAETAAKTKQTYSLFGIEVTLAGNKAENAIVGVDKNTKSLNENERAALAAKNAQKKYADSLFDREFDAYLTKGLLAKGYSPEQVKQMVETANWARKEGVDITNELYQRGLKALAIDEENKKVIDAKNKALKETTNELSKQQKLSKRLVGVSGNSGVGTGAHLDVRYGGSMYGRKVSNEHLARLQAGGKPLSSYKISSNYGPRQAPTKGASSFHKGIDFSMPEGTPITTNVAVKDIKTWYDSKGGGYVSEVIFEDGVTLKLLHQSPSMQSKVKGGASKGSDKASGDIQSQLDRQQDLQRSLENEVATEVERINNNRKTRLEEVDKAGFTPERTAEIKAELNRRADNDIAIAKQAIRSKLEDYKEFQKTEAELLKENFDRRKFNAAHDIELSKSEQKQAVQLLEQQYQQELGLMQLAQEQRLLQAKISYTHEVDVMRERYRLEREEISKTVRDPKQRGELLNASARAEDNEFADKRKGAWDNYRRTQGEMDGTSEYVNLDINYEDQAKVLEDAKKYELITAEEHEAAMFKIKQDYKDKKLALDLEYGQQAMGSLTSMFGSMFGEQSKAYKVMFTADKAYAIAVAGIEIQKGISKAIGLGFPANIPVIAQVVAQGASIFSNIRAIKDQGFANGGYTGAGGKYQVAGAVHKGEVVWSQEDIKRWGGVGLVENMRKSASPEAFINNHALNNTSTENVFNRSFLSSKAFNENQTISNIFNQPTRENQIIVKALKPSDEVVAKSGDVQKVEQLIKATSPDSFISNYAQNNTSFENVINRANQSSRAFNPNRDISNIFNHSYQDDQIISKGNTSAANPTTSANSDLFHDGKVYFSSNGLVQDRSNLEDVQDFTLGQSSRPQAEFMHSIGPSSPTINFKIEVVNQVSGATVEAEQLDEKTVRIIVKNELDKQLPKAVPKLVSEDIKNPNSLISRSLTENTTARRNR